MSVGASRGVWGVVSEDAAFRAAVLAESRARRETEVAGVLLVAALRGGRRWADLSAKLLRHGEGVLRTVLREVDYTAPDPELTVGELVERFLEVTPTP